MLVRHWLSSLFARRRSLRHSRRERVHSGQSLQSWSEVRVSSQAECLEDRTLPSAEPILLAESVEIENLTEVNGILYFTAFDQEFGHEVWSSDGTISGTQRITDINPGSLSSSPSLLTNVNGTLFFRGPNGLYKTEGSVTTHVSNVAGQPLANIDDILYFAGRDSSGTELWRSDGTNPGTFQVADIRSGTSGSYPRLLTNVSGTLFFSANDGTNGVELWKTSGVRLELVSDIRPGSGSGLQFFDYMTNVNGTLFFPANDGTSGKELWKSDSEGTSRVADIRVGSGSSDPHYLTNVNGTLFFPADDGTGGYDLWKSDGTTSGTVRLTDGDLNPYNLTDVNGVLFFASRLTGTSDGLWKSDGTVEGTTLLKTIRIDNRFPVTNLANVNGTLYFTGSGDGSNSNYELWRSDGTINGTLLVKDIVPGPNGSSPDYLTNVNGGLFFVAYSGAGGNPQLWYLPPTINAPPVIISDGGGSTASLSVTEGNFAVTIVIAADEDGPGQDLTFRISGGVDADQFAIDDETGELTFVTEPDFLNPVDQNGDNVYEVTVQVSDGHGGSVSQTLLVSVADEIENVAPIIISDGGGLFASLSVAEGTTAVTTVTATDADVPAQSLTFGISAGADADRFSIDSATGTLTFVTAPSVESPMDQGADNTYQVTVFVSDNHNGFDSQTLFVTVKVVPVIIPINAAHGARSPRDTVNVNGILFFRASGSNGGSELWKSDGTVAGTALVADIQGGSESSTPYELVNVNGVLFFSANDGTHGHELWKSDGTTAGTVLVKDILGGSEGSRPRSLTNVNGTLFFTAEDGVHGRELWRLAVPADEPQVNSSAVAVPNRGPIMPELVDLGPDAANPFHLADVDGTLFFDATDGVTGHELWRLDSAGASRVKDINSGPNGSFPNSLVNVNGMLLFSAFRSGNSGLWRSDGTESGTFLVSDRIASSTNALGQQVTQTGHIWETVNVNGTLFFTSAAVSNSSSARSLWRSDGTAAGTVLLKQLNSIGPAGDLTNMGGTLFFRASGQTNGHDSALGLWKSDGTSQGTVLVSELFLGSDQVSPFDLTPANGTLYFSTTRFGLNFGSDESFWKLRVSPSEPQVNQTQVAPPIRWGTPSRPNSPPVVAIPLSDVSVRVDRPTSFQLPLESFVDPDVADGDSLSYAITSVVGGSIWWSFDATNRRFTGTPRFVGISAVTITVTDFAGTSVSDTFLINVVDSTVGPKAIISTPQTSPTNATSLSFVVQFDMPVTGISPDDFQLFSLNVSNPPVGTIASVSSSSAAAGEPITVLVNEISGAGSLRLGLRADTNLVNADGLSVLPEIGPSVTIDQAAPTVNIVDVSPDPRMSPVLTLMVEFSERVTGVDRSDFSLTKNGVPVDLSQFQFVNNSSLTRSAYSFTGTAFTAFTNSVGRYRLSFDGIAGIADLAGNPLTAGDVEEWEFLDTQITNINGAILIEDIGVGTGFSNDNITIAIDPENANNILITYEGGRTASIPLNGLTTLIIDGTGGDDTVTVDFANGALPLNITFNGGPGGNDILNVRNADAFGLVNMTYDNVLDGMLEFVGGTTTRTLRYTGLEPITIEGTPAKLVFNLPSTHDRDVSLSLVGNMLRLAGSTFELTDFDPLGVTSITINGNAGNDVITIGDLGIFSGTLTVNGGLGNDRLNANNSSVAVTLIGDVGNDTLIGSAGNDTLRGGLGNDSLVGGTGQDVREEFVNQARLLLTNTTFGQDTLAGLEAFELFGDDRSNVIDASGYTLGAVTIHGGDGNDTLIGTRFNDVLDGGSGSDVVRQSSRANQTLAAGLTPGTMVANGAGSDLWASIEGAHLIGNGSSATTLNASAFTGRVTLEGGSGNDRLLGGTGVNSLKGNAGNDTLIGGDTSDTLIGGVGNDSLDGRGSSDLIKGNAGNDTIRGGSGDDRLYGEQGADLVLGGVGQDLIDGGSENDVLDGEGGDDTINGGAGNDAIRGANGDDRLSGGIGNDTILGGLGADVLRSDSGSDRLSGGTGDDRFEASGSRLSLGGGDDTIVGSNNRIDELFIFDFDRLLV